MSESENVYYSSDRIILKQEQGLGIEFIRCIDAKLAGIQRKPLQFQIVLNNDVRRALQNVGQN
jgi:hypothetical protein